MKSVEGTAPSSTPCIQTPNKNPKPLQSNPKPLIILGMGDYRKVPVALIDGVLVKDSNNIIDSLSKVCGLGFGVWGLWIVFVLGV